MESLKCVLIGDEKVGKTCMLIKYTNHYYEKDYKPTVFDLYSSIVEIKEKKIRLHLIDTAGQERFDSLRHLSLQQTDVFLICFSVINPESFQNIELKWLEEVKKFSPLAKIILVGTQIDMRYDEIEIKLLKINNEQPITHSEGLAMAKKIDALQYLECSALTEIGLQEVYRAAASTVFLPTETTDEIETRMSETQFEDPDSSMQKSEDDWSKRNIVKVQRNESK